MEEFDKSQLAYEVHETISKWAYITVNELKLSIAEKGMHMGDLYRSFTWKVYTDSEGMPTKVTIGFMYHGKFVDMGVGKGIKLENVKTNAEIWRNMSKAQKKGKVRRRPKKWYSPKIYHEYQRAAEILAGKYGIELPARFESFLTDKIEIKL
jgi:hypothetical protein